MKSTAATLGRVQQPKKWSPHSYQERAVRFMLEHGAGALFLEPGLGKTSVTLASFKVMQKEGTARRMLVVAPLRPCYLVWPAEIEEWVDFQHFRWAILHGDKKEKMLTADADIFIINYEGLDWLSRCPLGSRKSRLSTIDCDVVVFDESTKIKHTNTSRFKTLRPMLPTFRHRYDLTGTPNPNGYLDLFGQIYALDLGHALGAYISHYRSKFFEPTGFGGYDWKIRDGAAEEIQALIKPMVLRLDAEDYLDMPELVNNVIRVELPAAARKIYNDMEDQFLAELATGAITVTATNAGAAVNKCAQIANGGLYHEQPEVPDSKFGEARTRTAAVVHEAKTEALLDLIEELNGVPLLIAYEFQHDAARIKAAIKKRFGRDVLNIGGVSMLKAKDIERRWNAGELTELLGHPASMGHGLNLQKAGNHICWYGLTWDYELYDQLIRRIRRQGCVHAAVFVHHIIATKTVDEPKMKALAGKKTTQDGFLKALKDYAGERRKGTKK